jgi:hypothetical protein
MQPTGDQNGETPSNKSNKGAQKQPVECKVRPDTVWQKPDLNVEKPLKTCLIKVFGLAGYPC